MTEQLWVFLLVVCVVGIITVWSIGSPGMKRWMAVCLVAAVIIAFGLETGTI